MATQTRTAPKAQTAPLQDPKSKGDVALAAPRMPFPIVLKEEFGVTEPEWRTLTESIFPGAKTPEAVGMALAYCRKRNLDVYKRPVHIVSVYNSALNKLVETVWPGINELRTTAMRTKNFAGMDAPTYGPTISHTFGGGKVRRWENGQQYWETEPLLDLKFPEWCQITMYRLLHGNRVPFPGPRVYWLETYATKGRFSTLPNEMWEKRSNGQLEKCAEAAALRRAFPEEIGDDYVPEEIGAFHSHQAVDVTEQGSATTGDPAPPEPRREDEQPAQTSPGKETGPDDGSATRAEQTAAAGQVDKAALTDVEDLNDAPAELPVFENYPNAGRFFTFADEWLQDRGRTEAELVAFGAFYKDYISERLKPDYKSQPVHVAMVDTKRLYDEAMKRAAG